MSSSIQEVVSQFRNSIGGQSQNESGIGDAFSQMFNRRMERDRQGSMMDSFAQLFPNLPASIGTVPSGLDAAKAYFAQKQGDQLTVSPDAADKMEKDSSFASTVQGAIQAMMDQFKLMGDMPAGSTSQVGVTVTTITIRYTEIHYGSNGETLAGTDLVSEFKDRLKEMLESMFGKPADKAEEEDETAATDPDTDAVKSADVRDKMANLPANAYAGWSMQVMYSQTLVSMMGQQSQNSMSAMNMFGMSMGVGMGSMPGSGNSNQAAGGWAMAGGMSMGGAFQNGSIPNLFSSPFFSNMNASNGSFSNNELFFNLSGGTSGMSSLWNMLNNSLTPGNAVESAAEGEAVLDDAVAPVA